MFSRIKLCTQVLTDCFVYSNQDDDAKQFKALRYCLPKGIIKN